MFVLIAKVKKFFIDQVAVKAMMEAQVLEEDNKYPEAGRERLLLGIMIGDRPARCWRW